MTLKEKFIEQSIGIRYQVLEPKKFETIADDYAIEFYNWVIRESDGHDFLTKTTKELLVIFKKEKGL